MQQRQTISSRAAPPDHHHHAINVEGDDLPSCHHRRSHLADATYATYWVHAIPAFVILCFVLLWWFSSPVVLEMKAGTYPMDLENTSIIFGANMVELASWESMAPNASLPYLNITAPPGASQALMDNNTTTHG